MIQRKEKATEKYQNGLFEGAYEEYA